MKTIERVEFRHIRDGVHVGSDFHDRMLFGKPGGKHPRYVLGLTGVKEFLTSDLPPVIERHQTSKPRPNTDRVV